MKRDTAARGREELGAARSEGRGLFAAVALFSVFVNLLMLTGPIFMLQVYDRVLGSRSQETLAALFALVVFLFLMMGLLDLARGRVMTRLAARFQASLDRRVFTAALARSALVPGDPAAASGLRDLEAIRTLLAAPVFLALFDAPWAPFFLAAVFIFHPWLGWTAVAGGLVLVLVTALNQATTRRAVLAANAANLRAERTADQLRDEADLVQSLGMRGASFERWSNARGTALAAAIAASDQSGVYSIFSRTFRLFLQSAMLAVGALLVLKGELTPGAMIASSILMGRALAPLEQAVAGWALIQRAQEAWGRLAALLAAVAPETPRTALPRPRAVLEANQLTVVPPGQSQAALRLVSFRLDPGQALGVIGPSGAGKSTLARALTGVWRPAGGWIRLDGATLDQYDPDVLGGHVGYLPQRVTLFDGTIAENIARLAPAPDDAAVVAAAQKAAAHQMILDLPDGYDTRVSQAGGRLSGGQIQRIGLARALYGAPVIVVLDEPNSNLDNEGSMALNAAIRAIKAEGGSVLIMAHRPAAIQECDQLLFLDGGARRAYGPRDEVLRAMVKNAGDIARAPGPGGVT
ncbi:MAG: type I secretion system permease/ATPase [Rhodobacteraceae bacterium]|uniref:type I secretion system permease/ATPase n=1 Tax=Albidovulum sp. TaxID=1872424 RepID=UPI001E10A258|nr:type I secretion system permease/ATPase [uncultured Defluviimonas sp.]MCB2124562.1 type I secretion system permease/ATPase [Paracoccaceae bacterium]MCC0071380.1 type I secretion system permease/ATPase [Paracoccaceae bacterium]